MAEPSHQITLDTHLISYFFISQLQTCVSSLYVPLVLSLSRWCPTGKLRRLCCASPLCLKYPPVNTGHSTMFIDQLMTSSTLRACRDSLQTSDAQSKKTLFPAQHTQTPLLYSKCTRFSRPTVPLQSHQLFNVHAFLMLQTRPT